MDSTGAHLARAALEAVAYQSLDLIEAMYNAAALAQPITGRGIGYKLFTQGLIPSMALYRLPRLIGRDRALEAILSSDDYDADLAERYGWVTRTLPDAELDSFVDALAARLASFDKTALAAAKAQINRASLPPDADLVTAYGEFLSSLTWPGFQDRAPGFGKLVAELGADEVELHLGKYLGAANQQV